jgi:hypothetical protein
MALPGVPGGGQTISMSQINTELGRLPTATISLNTAEDGGYVPINPCSTYKPSASNPASMDEWHGYNHSLSCVIPCGTTQSNLEPAACEVPTIKTVDLGGLTSGLVSIPWTFTLGSGFVYNSVAISVQYNGSTVAGTGTIAVNTTTPTVSGTLTFTATGSVNFYTVTYTDPYCY